ncbi:hypothetical protein EVAR_7705_1 [Eumeta japonica]|uniref:Uncharacterized protein n=1 Tax=Eumeta variegata TaxID=151549 RepID=A0A4C1TLG2_EUMVA|nr:hypothetical protein EVAR_7705_1 [Eumeta japonica]
MQARTTSCRCGVNEPCGGVRRGARSAAARVNTARRRGSAAGSARALRSARETPAASICLTRNSHYAVWRRPAGLISTPAARANVTADWGASGACVAARRRAHSAAARSRPRPPADAATPDTSTTRRPPRAVPSRAHLANTAPTIRVRVITQSRCERNLNPTDRIMRRD